MAESIVRVAAGPVRGEPAGGAVVFRGIRCAAALVGADRFRLAHPARPWEGTADECLSLRAWTPGPAAGGVPVLAWIHGGSFTSGSGLPPEAARHGGVTIRHVSFSAAAGGYAASCAAST